jgi:hemerythrin-like domain-containing protein
MDCSVLRHEKCRSFGGAVSCGPNSFFAYLWSSIMENDRRRFLCSSAALGIGALILPISTAHADDKPKDEKKNGEEDVTATEDLMREHGVLNRVLLLYEEGLRRIHAKEDVAPEMFQKPAALVRKFVEDYHEKLEENFIFPEFEKRKKLADLVKVLRAQHEAGRKATDVILRESTRDRFGKEDARAELIAACQGFIRMYRPHEAREDTVLFPALHKVVSSHQLKELGEQFEKEEDRLFGEEGFEKTVDQVAVLEKQLGINDLAKFTVK